MSRTARFLTEPRLTWYAAGIALGSAVIAVMLWPALHSGAAGQHCLDFNWIWLTGKLAALGNAAQVYNPAAPLPPDIAAVPQFHCVASSGNGRFDYPPTVLFFTYPLGFLSYSAAMVAWNAATLVLYLAAVYAILPRVAAMLAALTTYPVVLNIMIGHNGFLTAGLFGLALAFIERRVWLSALCLGLLSYKPQFGVLFPLALLAAGNWRVFVAAAIATLLLAAAAALAFGHELWPLFVTGMSEMTSRLNETAPVSTNIVFPTVRGILRHLGFGAAVSWAGQAPVSLAAAAAVVFLWSRPITYELKAAALAVAALAATPYALSYDYCVLSMAVAFLVRDGMLRGFLAGERGVLLTCWIGLSFFAFVAAIVVVALAKSSGLGEPFVYFFLACVPLIICTTLLIVVGRRAMLLEPSSIAAQPI